MRKLVAVLLLCVVIVGCKRSERNAAEDTLTADATMPQVATVPDTAPPVAMDSAATAAANTATTSTQTPAPSPVGFPVYADTDSNVDVFAPPKKPESDYLADTFYAWPDKVVGWVKAKAPGLEEFQLKNREQIVARRAREGYTPLESYDIPAMRTRSPHPLYSYAHTIVIYRKPRS